MDKPKKILYHPLNAPDGHAFDADQAERMLKQHNNGGWTAEKPKAKEADNAEAKKGGKKDQK